MGEWKEEWMEESVHGRKGGWMNEVKGGVGDDIKREQEQDQTGL